MFDLFGFSPKEFSDDELSSRITELGKRIIWASRMGQTGIVGQLQSQQIACQNELRERAASPRFQRMLQSSPTLVESDPDLAQQSKEEREAKAERESPKKGPRAKPMTVTGVLKPTSKPTSD